MTKNHEIRPFDEQGAANYDDSFAKLDAFKKNLHLSMHLLFSDLPENANILCVGAGTGAEIVYLASQFPKWTFTAVEPAAPMLNMCRKRMEENGFSSRCSFHEGYIETLDSPKPFDAATSILVSQFITDQEKRKNFFGEISKRLKANGLLFSSDLCIPKVKSNEPNPFFPLWQKAWKFCGSSDEKINSIKDVFHTMVAALTPQEVEALIEAGGFTPPIQMAQSIMIHAWFAKKVNS